VAKREVQGRPPLASMLVRLRQAKDWTQQDLAQRAGVSLSFLGMVEAGARNPSADTLSAIAEALTATETERKTLERLRRAERVAAGHQDDRRDLGLPRPSIEYPGVGAQLERIRERDPAAFAALATLITRAAERLDDQRTER